jgi:hypothetical protein
MGDLLMAKAAPSRAAVLKNTKPPRDARSMVEGTRRTRRNAENLLERAFGADLGVCRGLCWVHYVTVPDFREFLRRNVATAWLSRPIALCTRRSIPSASTRRLSDRGALISGAPATSGGRLEALGVGDSNGR